MKYLFLYHVLCATHQGQESNDGCGFATLILYPLLIFQAFLLFQEFVEVLMFF